MLAGITKTAELALSPPEAKSLAEAVANVSRHYDVSVSAKALDWSNLVMALGMVYGTRLIAIRTNRRAARARSVQQPEPMQATNAAPAFDMSAMNGEINQ